VNDQAAGLRAMGLASRRPYPEPEPEGPPVVVVGSGKGGVGKSVLSVLLAAAFARSGRRTLLLDGAQNQGNLHILLGVRPVSSLGAVLAGEVEPAALQVPVADRLVLLPGDSGAEALYSLGAVDRARLHRRLSTLYDGYDAVVVDGGTGIESVVRAGGIRGSSLVVVAAPEPASLADAYALLKIVNLQVPSLPIEVMVNRVLADEEGQAVFDRLHLAADRFLRRELHYLGCVPEDESLRLGARRPGALLEMRSDAIDAIAARLLDGDGAVGARSDAIPVTDTRGLGT
jgi:flagellar biosynthesis protein FlhG